MTEKILKNNQAVVAGEIISDFEFSHEVFGEGFYFVKLKVSRLSHSSDIIPVSYRPVFRSSWPVQIL